MKICGIIAEYNPFHNGHKYQIEQTRKILGSDTEIICVMSGNFVQRGDFAIMEKYKRAQSAIACGADLVLELPLSAVLSSAEGFAFGAVSMLENLGIIDFLSFGSECGSTKAIMKAAELLDSQKLKRAFDKALKEGNSYATAKQQALVAVDENAGKLLSTPNNTLGIEYVRALNKLDSVITPLTIQRTGASHDSTEENEHSVSATFIREKLKTTQNTNYIGNMPCEVYEILKQELDDKHAPVFMENMDTAILSYLRRLSANDFARYESDGEGLTNRLFSSIQESTSFYEACDKAKTKRYPLARIRRAYLRAFLDLPLSECNKEPEYIRVLAASSNGRKHLKQLSKSCKLPIITKPLHEKTLEDNLQTSLNRDILSDSLYALAMENKSQHTGGVHFTRTPFVAD